MAECGNFVVNSEPDSLAAYFADEKTLFSSDTILANAKYGFMPDYHFCNFLQYSRKIVL